MFLRHSKSRPGRAVAWFLSYSLLCSLAGAQMGSVRTTQKISSTEGGFTGPVKDADSMGYCLAPLGDFDADGTDDLVVGAPYDDDGGPDRGAVWMFLLNPDGSVKSPQKISGVIGNFGGPLADSDFFGWSVAFLGDLDGDGVGDLAIGAPGDDDNDPGEDLPTDRGAVWILFLNSNRTVKASQKISDASPGFGGVLNDGDAFGSSLAPLGDLNGDGVVDLAVGAPGDPGGGTGRGAVWVLFLNADGSVKGRRKIGDAEGGFSGELDDDDRFGAALATLGHTDGAADLVVGAPGDDDGGEDRGALWTLRLSADGSVKSHEKISAAEGDFAGALNDLDAFGLSIAPLGDLDSDGVTDLAVGASGDDGGTDRGAVWILLLHPNGRVKASRKISSTAGAFTGALDDGDRFGRSVAPLGDLDGDGVPDLAVGSPDDDDGGTDRGAVWVLTLEGLGLGSVIRERKISSTQGGLGDVLLDPSLFGDSMASIGDLNGDGINELAVGAPYRDVGASLGAGAVFILFFDNHLTLRAQQMIRPEVGGFTGPLTSDNFASAIASLGDLDGDGTDDIAVGAAGSHAGEVWILFLNKDGTVRAEQKIGSNAGGFDGALDTDDQFGGALASLGDLDGDGIVDLAVGAAGDDDGRSRAGALWILFLNRDGTVKSHQKISSLEGGFQGPIAGSNGFALGVASLGDLDGDGVTDLAVGDIRDSNAGPDRGAVWILFLNTDGTVKAEQKISAIDGLSQGSLEDEDRFGSSVESLGDLDGDGIADLLVGAPGDDDGGSAHGALWLLFLDRDGTVKSHKKISDTEGNFTGVLASGDQFGRGTAVLGDMDADGSLELAVGAAWDDDGGLQRGAAWILSLAHRAPPPFGTSLIERKISSTEGGFSGALANAVQFGSSAAPLGDFDGDGVGDIVVGASQDSDGGSLRGAVWIVLLNADGSVKSERKISDTEGGFEGALANLDQFGASVASLGDLDGDGVIDIAVGSPLTNEPNIPDSGAVWILFLNPDSTVKSHHKISAASGDIDGALDGFDQFGVSLASLGDFDGDGVVDLAAGAVGDDDGSPNRGAVYLLFLNTDGTVKRSQKISSAQGGLGPDLAAAGRFGSSISLLGDLDDDGVPDLAVGANADNDGGPAHGAVWVLFLNPLGSVKAKQKISDTEGGFNGFFFDFDNFGASVGALGDLDGDRIPDLAVGSSGDEDGGNDRGAVWFLFLNRDGTVKSHAKISSLQGGFAGDLDNADRFGLGVAPLGDLNADGRMDLAVGTPGDDDGGADRGALWIVSIKSFVPEPGFTIAERKISNTEGDFDGVLFNLDSLGASVTALGDLDGDGIGDVAVGAPGDDDGGLVRGAVWILFLTRDGKVKSHQKISATSGQFIGALSDGDAFGASVVALGDVDGDGVVDLAVGAPGDEGGGDDRGAVWLLFLNPDGTVKSHAKIRPDAAPLAGFVDDGDRFGASLAAVGDLDGNGFVDLAVGAPGDDGVGADRGALWLLLLASDGAVESARLFSSQTPLLAPLLSDGDEFGGSVAALGDINGDGQIDLAVGAPGDDEGGTDRGAIWTLLLNPDLSLLDARKIAFGLGGFTGALLDGDRFGASVATMQDLDRDGRDELLVGAPSVDGAESGALWVLSLQSDGSARTAQKLNSVQGGFLGPLVGDDRFGSSVSSLGDIDGDGVEELAIGAAGDDDGGPNRGAIWIASLGGPPANLPFTIFDATPEANASPSEFTSGVEVILQFARPCPPGLELELSVAGSPEKQFMMCAGQTAAHFVLPGGDGLKRVTVRLRNGLGPNFGASREILLDTAPPTATAPTDIGDVSPSTTVTFNWSEPTDEGSGIQSVQLEVGSTRGAADLFAGDVTGLVSFGVVSERGATLFARLIVTDRAGNVTTTASSDGVTVSQNADLIDRITRHLLGQEIIPPEQQAPFDANADGKLDVADLIELGRN